MLFCKLCHFAHESRFRLLRKWPSATRPGDDAESASSSERTRPTDSLSLHTEIRALPSLRSVHSASDLSRISLSAVVGSLLILSGTLEDVENSQEAQNDPERIVSNAKRGVWTVIFVFLGREEMTEGVSVVMGGTVVWH